jgi:hypothetical protein
MTLPASYDFHDQLRSLYQALLSSESRFDEFKRLLQLYDFYPRRMEDEPPHAEAVRQFLNARIRQWIGDAFDGLTATQALQWREIIVEERYNTVRFSRRPSTNG